MNDAEQVKPTVPTAERMSRGGSLFAVGLAFAASFGLGRYVASPSETVAVTEAESAVKAPADAKLVEAKPAEKKAPAKPAVPMDPSVARIPVSISQPRSGPEDALVTVVQWCDLPDPECQKIEPALQAVLKRHQEQVSLVFRHFFRPSAPDSERAHQFSRSAHEHAGKFWEARKLLLAHKGPLTDADFERYAKKLKLDWAGVRRDLVGKTHASHVTADRVFATMFDVEATPAIFANGRRLVGEPTEAALEKLVSDEIVRAKKLVENGVPKAELYAELTKNGTWKPPPTAVRRP